MGMAARKMMRPKLNDDAEWHDCEYERFAELSRLASGREGRSLYKVKALLHRDKARDIRRRERVS